MAEMPPFILQIFKKFKIQNISDTSSHGKINYWWMGDGWMDGL